MTSRAADRVPVGPVVPVLVGEGVLDGDDGVSRAPCGQLGDEFLRDDFALVDLEPVCLAPGVVELGGGHVDRDRDVGFGLQAGGFDAAHEHVESGSVGRQPRAEAALVGNECCREPHLVEDGCGSAAHPPCHFDRLGERVGADRHDEEVLDVECPPGVGASGDDVDHRHRQQRTFVLCEYLPVERPVSRCGCSRCCRERDGEHSIRAEPLQTRGAVG